VCICVQACVGAFIEPLRWGSIVCMYVYSYVYVYVHFCKLLPAYILTHVHVQPYKNIPASHLDSARAKHTHTHTHIRTHMHIHTYTYIHQVFVQRVFEESQTYDGEMDFKAFLDFVLAMENRNTRAGMQVCVHFSLDVCVKPFLCIYFSSLFFFMFV
jgi:hypothetical protein